MAGSNPQIAEPEPKRRKIRKGTQSCWECRRRKVRCIFTASSDAICDNCRRRGTTCISQEHPDKPIPAAGSCEVEARLGRVEELIEHLVDGRVSNSPARDVSVSEGHSTELEPRPLSSSTSGRCAGIPAVVPVVFEAEAESSSLSIGGHNIVQILDTSKSARLRPPPLKQASSAPVIATSYVQTKRVAGKYETLCQALTSAWPSQSDIETICTLSVGLSVHLQGRICTPYSSSIGVDPPSPREMLQLPPPGSHPVLIARKLLILGSFLQSALPTTMQDLSDQGASCRDIMSRVVDTATRLVTTNEDLINSVEGIECILIEAMYQNYAGNLHRAWMAVRRGTAVAQMMALHRGLNSSLLKILEPETRAAFNPDQICFRLVEMDCYLSVMLGLPRTSLGTHFATPKALEGCQPIDRMQRMHCVVSDRILQRNENDLSETHEIDKLLQKAAAEMPPQWWLIPDLLVRNLNGTKVLHETNRLMDQFVHYHLVIRLHLPYMLRPSSDRRYLHSKITAVSVGRETLARFVAFHASNPTHFYCRGTDFIAFIATTVLCLAYIDSYSRRQGSCQDPQSTDFNFLAHSRPSDRGLMERTFDILESMARVSTDAIASKIACILGHLLAAEANAANGTSYSTNSSKGDEEELDCHGKLSNGGKGLHVHIPYFGTINFERRTISKSSSAASTALECGLPTTLVGDSLGADQLGGQGQQPSSCQIDSQLNHDNLRAEQSHSGQPTSLQQPPSPGNQFSSFGSHNMREDQVPLSVEVASAEDDWDLQGVDVALFDSMFRGTGILDAFEEETWVQWDGNG